MVIRRIREHAAKQNWFAVAIDFLIVVAGIVIGTQVNNWNQARIERQQGSEYRQRLIAELESNEAHNQDRRAYWHHTRRHAQAALADLQKPTGNDRQFLIDAYQASQALTSQSKRFTYDELISTGRFEEIGDAELRGEIAGYYMAVQTYGVNFNAIAPYREDLRQIMPSVAQQAVRTNCPEIYYPGPDGSPFVRLPEQCTLRLDDSTAASAATAIRSASFMVRDLNRLIADLDVKLSLLSAMDEHSRRVRLKIARALAL